VRVAPAFRTARRLTTGEAGSARETSRPRAGAGARSEAQQQRIHHGDQPGEAGCETSTRTPPALSRELPVETTRRAAPSRDSAIRACTRAAPDRRRPGCETRTGTPPETPHESDYVTPRRGRGASSGESTEHRVGDGIGVVGVGPRASAGERHAVIRDATTQAAEPPGNQMQSKHCVPGRIAHAVGPPRPSARRRGRASGPAGGAGFPPWRILAASPKACLDPPHPVDHQEQRQAQGAESRRPAENHERERGGAPAPDREARA
jgi:hypothetical protein